MSLPEVLLWRELKKSAGHTPQFRRQHPLGPYVLDFFCARARLCVEVDGYAHGTADRPARDARRDGFLKNAGIFVQRVSARSVLDDPYAVAQWVRQLAAGRMEPTA